MKKIAITLLTITVLIFGTYAQNFEWARSIGGTSSDFGSKIVVDASGNTYITGSYQENVDFDPGTGTYYLSSEGVSDIFISKLDTSGNLLWAKSIGGSGLDVGASIAIDPSGNVYITGSYQENVDFDPGTGTYYLSSEGISDIFISKLDNSGNFLWAKSMGGSGNDSARSIAIDASGNVYTTGHFSGTFTDFDPEISTYNLTSDGEYDIFISKLDASGNFLWAKSMGGTSHDEGKSITIDASGNVYITGNFHGTAEFNPGTGSSNLTSVGLGDIFISKLNSTGNFLWAKNIGSISSDEGNSITIDASGDVYTTGYFEGTADFDPGTGTYNLTSAGGYDIFISKLNSSGNFLWAKNLGSTSSDEGKSIVSDASGNIYIIGSFRNTVDFNSGTGIYNLTSAGGSDIFVSKLDASGLFLWAHSLGDTYFDAGGSIAIDASENIYTTGYFGETTDFDPGTGTYNLTSAGLGDIFISKLSQCVPVSVYTTTTSLTLTVNTAGATYQWLDCNNNFAPITGEIGQSFTATENGNYAVEVTENGCTNTSTCIVISEVGIKEATIKTIKIYPNPTKHKLNIDNGGLKINDIRITDISGKTIPIAIETTNKTNNIIDVSKLVNGIYFIHLQVENSITNIKFVKE